MPTCLKCGGYFPNWVKLPEGTKNLRGRHYCLACSPWGKHNTVVIHSDKPQGRRCPRCKTTRPLDGFYSRRGVPGSSAYCKRCTNEQTADRMQALKRLAVAYKGGKCAVCGYDRYLGAMQFHHVDPSSKDFTVGNKRSKTLEAIKPELDKCVLVCSRCHAEIEGGFTPCPT